MLRLLLRGIILLLLLCERSPFYDQPGSDEEDVAALRSDGVGGAHGGEDFKWDGVRGESAVGYVVGGGVVDVVQEDASS